MLKFSASMNFMFREQPFLDRFAAAAEAGFTGVEIQLMEAPVSETARAAREAGVEVVLINADMGDLGAGGAGLSGVPGKERDFARAATQAAESAEILGASLVHLGPSRVPAGASRDSCVSTYLKNVERALALDAFSSGRVRPLLEPMNPVDMPDALFTDPHESARLLKEALHDRVGLQFDIYHIEKSGLSALTLWEQYCERIAHVQFSDVPRRSEPGTGSIDFRALFTAIAHSDYRGWTGAEYHPTKPTSETLSWLRPDY